ncbi:SsgA family sporulation/cell division regulator [Streptomyces sp. H27-C3]|uniref:SsgA family sporulation/cell division regulator n=1 Tax=Streptomyces sp. H27-C3 TaxID=3046305 RepID=UPI0024BA7342|nr:SsgA family sporulation/cell division regulator [Streptomyces sp. H27-C3]MDJ0460505.1 SsgA family sporulation/cell division regulator [Streptomyces sp. H27-C3]
MHPVIEDHARARLITDAPYHRSVPVALIYDMDDDPLAVCLVFPAGVSPGGSENEWTLARTLLETGLSRPVETESGDVRVWPCGRVQAVLELHSPQGVAVIQFDRAPLLRFLRRTYTATPAAGSAAVPATPAPPAATPVRQAG